MGGNGKETRKVQLNKLAARADDNINQDLPKIRRLDGNIMGALETPAGKETVTISFEEGNTL